MKNNIKSPIYLKYYYFITPSTLLIILSFSINVFGQEQEIPSACCYPQNHWEFSILNNNCTDAAPNCGEIEISSAICSCTDGLGQETCCNFYTTHGTPSLEIRSGRSVGKLWFNNTGGEGLSFCVSEFNPACYTLTFTFILTHQLHYDNFLNVYVANPNFLPEVPPANPPFAQCFASPPTLPPGASLLIASIDLSQFPLSNTAYYQATVGFQTNSSVVDINKGFFLWFYPTATSNTNQKAVGIDNITLTNNFYLLCQQDYFLDEGDVPFQLQYNALSTITITGATPVTVTQDDFFAADQIDVTPMVDLVPGTKDYVNLELQPCPTCPIFHNPIIEPEEEEESHFVSNSMNESAFESLDSLESISIKDNDDVQFLIIDLYQGLVKVIKSQYPMDFQAVDEAISSLPKNRVYQVNRIYHGHLSKFRTYYNFNK